ncbi:MAG TPA: hypothetical protein VN047_19925 [Sphingopyxis sp.]|uniref:hypothetical protein n=1 Tax=Sphingopyxis sp. TaxID=1908224 RepID=UPI002C7EA969|nr:hypothetical protein [Sphingopyxis sp.]HWW59173.1 hypothetical protein [Sphingopyxis sp.]
MIASPALAESYRGPLLRGFTARGLLYGALLVVLALQVELAFSKSVNWDEFFHFSQIHQHLLGRPAPWLQSPFVALFSWVPGLPGDNVAHIQLIRLMILPFEVVAIAAIVGMAGRFASFETALFCGLLYATGGYVFLHAFALRADMIAAALLSVAMWIGLCRPLRAAEIAAILLLLALAFVSTIKAVLYAPAFFGIALYRLENRKARVALAATAGAAVLAGVLLLWGAPHLPAGGLTGWLRDIGDLGNDAAGRMFGDGLFLQMWALHRQILFAPLLAAAVLLAVTYACKPERDPMERTLLLLLLAPLATIAVYRNAFPYHFVFILPPAMVAIAPAIAPVVRRFGVAPLAAILLASALLLSFVEDRRVLPRQRVIVTGVHTIFPEPVTYIDNSGMAGDFPRAINHFAGGWGLEIYHRAGEPLYSRAMAAEPVPMLLANNMILQNPFIDANVDDSLLPADEQILRENYIPHWGYVYVAGRTLRAGGSPVNWEVAVPGTYTVEGDDVVIDAKPRPKGSLVHLARGDHLVQGSPTSDVTLRWGDHLVRPVAPWPEGRVFTTY